MNQASTSLRRLRAAAVAHPTSLARQMLIVLGAGIGMGGGFAALYFSTLSVFLKPLAQEFAWGRAQTAAATGLAMVGLAIGSMLVGRTIDRFGPLRVISVSAAAMAALIAGLSGLPDNPGVLAGLSFCIGLAGVGTTPPGYLSLLARSFDRRLGFALGAAMVGLGLGTIAMPMLAQHLITAHGWRSAYVALAGLAFGFALVALGLLRAGGTNASPAAARALHHDAAFEGDTLRQAACSLRFWVLVAIVLVVSAAGLGSGFHIASLLTDRGLDAATAARIVAFTGAGITLGRLIAGALLDHVPAPRLGALAFVLGAIGLALLASDQATSVAALSTGAFLAGFVVGAEGDFIPFVVRRYFGLRSFGAIFGTLFGVYALGGVLGPVAFGLAFDRLGGYAAIYTAAAVACTGCALATLFIGRYRFGAAAH